MRPIGRENERYGLSPYDNITCLYLRATISIIYALFLADKKNVEKSPNLKENIGKLNSYILRNLNSAVCSKTIKPILIIHN